MHKLVLFLLACIFSYNVQAACDSIGCNTKLKRLYISGTSAGHIFIEPSDNAKGIVNCEMAENKFFTLKKNHALHPEMYSALLASAMAEKRIRIRIKEGTNDCEINYVWVYGE